MSCQWRSNPQPAVKWQRKGGSGVILSSGPELSLYNVKQEQSGTYICRASAPPLPDKYQEIELSVYGPPLFNSPQIQRAVVNGDDVTIICSITGNPGISNVKWSWTDATGAVFNISGNGSTGNSKQTSSTDQNSGKYASSYVLGSTLANLTI